MRAASTCRARISQRVAKRVGARGARLPATAIFFAIIVSMGSGFVPSPAAAQQSRLVDRLVAVVDGEVITLQQLHRAVALISTDLVDGRTLACEIPESGEATDSEIEGAVLDCMIDDLLVFQHVRRFPQFGVVQEDIVAEYARMASRFESTQDFEEALRGQGLTPEEVRYDLERRALVGNYISARYRSMVDVREDDLHGYYEEVLRPEMERQGAEMPAFENVDDEWIRPILVEAEVGRRVDDWVASLRRRAEIIVYVW